MFKKQPAGGESSSQTAAAAAAAVVVAEMEWQKQQTESFSREHKATNTSDNFFHSCPSSGVERVFHRVQSNKLCHSWAVI